MYIYFVINTQLSDKAFVVVVAVFYIPPPRASMWMMRKIECVARRSNTNNPTRLDFTKVMIPKSLFLLQHKYTYLAF
jgi:hypothetical protein